MWYPPTHGACIYIYPSSAFTFIYLFSVHYRLSYSILFVSVLFIYVYVYFAIKCRTIAPKCIVVEMCLSLTATA